MKILEKLHKELKTKKKMDFNDMWEFIKKDFNFSTKDEELEKKNDLYTSLIMDQKFIYLGNREWSVKDFYSYEELKKILESNYDIGDKEDEIETDALFSDERFESTREISSDEE